MGMLLQLSGIYHDAPAQPKCPLPSIIHLQIYPVKLTQQAIQVDISKSTVVAKRSDRGGAGTSLENNNVFTVQVRKGEGGFLSSCDSHP